MPSTALDILQQIRALQLSLNPPEWMVQHMKIQSGEIAWEDLSFRERTCKGWLWPYLLQIDSLPNGSGRWRWWMEAHAIGRLPDTGIPQIRFRDQPDHTAMRMLEKCLDVNWDSGRLPDLLDWILWGFGEGEGPPRISDKLNEKWYRMFNLGLMIVNPADYWGYLYSETKGRGSWNRSGFYPTPQCICNAMLRMTFGDPEPYNGNGKDPRLQRVSEPCVGTCRMLMEASNYSVNLYGQDLDYVCVAASKINGYLYIPWLVRPAYWIESEELEEPEEDIIEELKSIPVAKKPIPHKQLELF